jgi:hypothetical protein
MHFGKKQRVILVIFIAVIVAGIFFLTQNKKPQTFAAPLAPGQISASAALAKLEIKPLDPHDGYSRKNFASGWADMGSCNMRDWILARDLSQAQEKSSSDCTILSGTLKDPYTGKSIAFKRGPGTSSIIQIDHVVAISDAWQTGAQEISSDLRAQLYNDPLELLAVSGKANDDKSASDASQWLPPDKAYDCRYVARQIAVKIKYRLWITKSEQVAMQKVLDSCPGQVLPSVSQ